jgi:Replication-relaxation
MAGTNPYNLILQPRDRHLLEELEVLRVIDREQAGIIAPFGSVTRANTRLLALTRANVLERAFCGTITGGRKAVYFRSRARLRARAGWHERGFAHQIGIGDVYLSLKYEPTPGRSVQLERWLRFETVLSEQIRLIPDGYALLRMGDSRLPVFVEVDCGTEQLNIWERKIAAYLELASTGEFEQLFGSPRFRVLVTTSGWTRCRNLARLISRKTDKVFWITTSSAMRRQGVWADIWARPDGRTAQPFLPRAPNQ